MIEVLSHVAIGGSGDDRKNRVGKWDDRVTDPHDFARVAVPCILGNERVEGGNWEWDTQVEDVVVGDVEPEGVRKRDGEESEYAEQEADAHGG